MERPAAMVKKMGAVTIKNGRSARMNGSKAQESASMKREA